MFTDRKYVRLSSVMTSEGPGTSISPNKEPNYRPPFSVLVSMHVHNVPVPQNLLLIHFWTTRHEYEAMVYSQFIL